MHTQVPAAAGSSSLRPDAAVNAANVMCSLAELVGGQEGYSLLDQAVQLYRTALEQEEDAAVSALSLMQSLSLFAFLSIMFMALQAALFCSRYA
jgi:hypothetical protein